MKTKYLVYAAYVILFAFIVLTVYFNLSNAQNQTKNNQRLKIMRNLTKLRLESNVNKEFDQIPKYYINLDRSKYRLKLMKEEITKYNVKNIERFPAVDGSKLESIKEGKIREFNYKNLKDSKISFSELGITLSHLLLIKKIYDLKLPYALIMEDDMHFSLSPYWEESIQNIIKKCSDDFELIYLTYSSFNDHFSDKLKIEKIDYIEGACAYIISDKGAKNIVEKYFQGNTILLPKKVNIDIGILPLLNTFLVKPMYFINHNPYIESTKGDFYTDNGLNNNIKTIDYYLKKKEQQNEV